MRTRDLVKKADAYFDQRKYRQALALYDQAIDQKPNDAELYQSKGEALAQMGRYEDAIKSYEKAIKLNPKEWWYHLWKADAFFFVKQPAKALASYRKANALNPRSTAALYGIAMSYVQLGMKRAACRALRTVLELKPEYRERIIRDRRFKSIRDEQEFQAIGGKRKRRQK